ncbi:MAG: hypothetical protein FJ387_17450 [Verrucomicrobia bacterium]|nr:hypothetical protein [Verrucomicrobiota bacterium]
MLCSAGERGKARAVGGRRWGWGGRVLGLAGLGLQLQAGEPLALRDTYSDTWVATDALGRTLPVGGEVGLPRPDRTVGIFYFLWHGAHIQGGPYDVSRILAQEPEAMSRPDSPLWGPLHAPHHWGESIFGYYLTDDEEVLRKHAQMLDDAGVDVAIFDVTNQVTYRDWYGALLRVWTQMRALGNRTPQVAFLTPFGDPTKVVRDLWRDLYEPGRHADLWFRWEGKALILADPKLVVDRVEDPRLREFFTFRKPQPDYFQGPTGPDMWSWLEVYPQHVFRNARGEKEQMSVGVGQNAVGDRLGSMSEPGARGRSFHQGATDGRPGAVLRGLNVQEQWVRALAEDPRVIFITGWNEWIAGRFAEFNRIRLPVMFVDQFDQEHSRDIEPMKGGHGDNYLYQMAGFIRRYKGARSLPALVPAPIAIDGQFGDWSAVEPEFRDTLGDPVRRQHRGWDPQVTYTDLSGRNDLTVAKVSFDADRVYFYARTRLALSPATDPSWMLLFLDVDTQAATGWLGYDFVVNRTRWPGRGASIEIHAGDGYRWQPAGRIEFQVCGQELELAIPWAALGLRHPPAQLDFKWADHVPETGDWSDFTLHGDAAPNDRYNYRAHGFRPASSRDDRQRLK